MARYHATVGRVLTAIIPNPVPLGGRDTDDLNVLRLPQSLYRLYGSSVISFSLLQEYYVRTTGSRHGPWAVDVAAYAYQVYGPDERELLAFHWHPVATPLVTFPHVHVRSDAVPLSHKTHIPTGHVSLADVVRLLIVEFGVPPLREDWQTIINNEQ